MARFGRSFPIKPHITVKLIWGIQYTKTLTDIVNVASTILKTIGKIITSEINASSVFIKLATKRMTDSFIIATLNLDTFKAMGLTLMDSLNISSIYSRVLTMTRTFTESINVTPIFLKSTLILFQETLIMVDVTISKLLSKILTFIETIIAHETFSMRLNGVLLKWRIIIRDIGSSYWSLKTRVTSLWTEKPRQE